MGRGDAWQYRAELEWPDIPVATALPPGWRWSDTCYWIVNSDGTANDPQRRLIKHGGQLHTAVARDPAELAEQTAPVFTAGQPGANYRSSLRIGVRIPELQDDLPRLKRLADYTRTHLPSLFHGIDPLTELTSRQPEGPHRSAAAARLAATTRFRHYMIPERQHQMRMAATTITGFLLGELTPRPDGRPAAILSPRECLDLRAVSDTGWITMRCFAHARNTEQIAAAAGFTADWLRCALTAADPLRPVTRWMRELPRQMRFHYPLEQGWQATNLHHNPRRAVQARLRRKSSTPG